MTPVTVTVTSIDGYMYVVALKRTQDSFSSASSSSVPVRAVLANLLIGELSSEDPPADRRCTERFERLVDRIDHRIEELQCVLLLAKIDRLAQQTETHSESAMLPLLLLLSMVSKFTKSETRKGT